MNIDDERKKVADQAAGTAGVPPAGPLVKEEDVTQTVEKGPEEKVVKGQLLDVVFETTLHAEYVFPDMDAQQALGLLRAMPLAIDKITLVNASGACLILPARIIEKMRIYENVKAASPEPLHSWSRT